jgi:hypothetical protein
MGRAAGSLLALLLVSLCSVAAQRYDEGADVAALLSRIGIRMEQYFARAQSIMCEETVRFQALGNDLTWNGSHVRELVYELRVSWEPPASDAQSSEANVVRQLISVDGRRPRDGDEPGCMDPRPVSPEPLAMLLPRQQRDYAFTRAGTKRVGIASAVMLDFKSVSTQPPTTTWKGDCVSVDLPGRWRGRIWVETETLDVLRLDEQLIGTFEVPLPKQQARLSSAVSLTIERANSSTRYRRVRFSDPDETVMLPESIVSLQVIRDSGLPRVRTFQTFSHYRRFITAGRVVTDAETR